MKTALLFPGQGSQEVGMGADLARSVPAARAVFEEADDILGFALSRLAWEGPEDELRATQNAQPALLVHSVAVLRAVEDLLERPAYVAGHSLGEYTAHVAAGSLSFQDAVLAVRRRGELMHDAGERVPGTMAAIIGMEDAEVEAICAGSANVVEVCVPANYNAPGQIVVSGTPEGVRRVGQLAAESGARKVIPLNVAGAFHSPLMEDAAGGLREFLGGLAFRDPSVPVVANVTARPVTAAGEVADILVQQLTAPVRWRASVEYLARQGVEHCFEIGQGRVLCGLVRRIERALGCTGVEHPDELAEATG